MASPNDQGYTPRPAPTAGDLAEHLRLLQTGRKGQRFDAAKEIERFTYFSGERLPREVVRTLVGWLKREGHLAAARTRGPVLDSLARSRLEAAEVRFLLRFIQRHHPRGYAAVAWLIGSPHATADDFELACEHFRASLNVREALAARPEAISLPSVRAAFENTRVPKLLRALALNGPVESFRSYVVRMMRWSRSDVPGLLNEAAEERLRTLYTGDLLPLLQDPREEHRLAAIRAAGLGLKDGKGPRIATTPRGRKEPG